MKNDWKDIKGFENLYQLNSEGQIKSLGNGLSNDPRLKQVRIMKTRTKPNGYVSVKLSKEGKPFHLSVHRLVAQEFIENKNNLPEVNHIDGNKTNNNSNNLEWVTSSENQKHAFKIGLQKIVRGKDHKQSKPVLQFSLNQIIIKRWESIKQIKRETGFNTIGIIGCCKNKKKYKTAYGYKWQYEAV